MFSLILSAYVGAMTIVCTKQQVPHPYYEKPTVRVLCRMTDTDNGIICYWMVGAENEKPVCILVGGVVK